MANSLVSAVQTALKLQRQWVQQAWTRSLLAWAIALGLVTAIANAWGVPALNQKLPQLAQQATVVLQRDVHIGRVYWVAPTGVTGLHPLASVGPISVGAGPVEGSNATLERVSLGFSPIQSIFRGRLVLTVKVGGAEVHLKQADNFSWFGFPDDTTPSSRDFVPGLNENLKGKNGKGGSGGDPGGGGVSGGGNAPTNSNPTSPSSRQPGNTARKSATSEAAAIHTIPAPLAAISSSSSNNMIASIAQELFAWHAAHDKAAQDSFTMACTTTSSEETTSSSSSLKSDEHAVAPAENLLLLNTATSYPSLASMSVSSVPSPSPSSSTSSHNEDTSTSTAATSIKGNTSGWRSLLPFQSNAQKDAQKEEKKTADARKQQLDKLNSIKISVAGGNSIRKSSQATSNSRSIEGSEVPADTPIEEAPAATAAASEKVENTVASAADAVGNASSVATQTTATSVDDFGASKVAIDSNTTTARAEPSATAAAAADVQPLERENKEIQMLRSDGSNSEEETATSPETRLTMSSTRAASILNSLPTLSIDIRSRSNIAAEEEEGKNDLQQQQEPPVESTAAKSINSLGEIAKGEIAPPVEILQKDPKLANFKEIVLDQATVRKKGELRPQEGINK